VPHTQADQIYYTQALKRKTPLPRPSDGRRSCLPPINSDPLSFLSPPIQERPHRIRLDHR